MCCFVSVQFYFGVSAALVANLDQKSFAMLQEAFPAHTLFAIAALNVSSESVVLRQQQIVCWSMPLRWHQFCG